MRARERGQTPFGHGCQPQEDAPLVQAIVEALDQPALGQPFGQLDGLVVSNLHTLGEIADRDRLAASVPLDDEQGLMMPRRQAGGLRLILAELEEAAEQIAKLGKRRVVLLGQSGLRHSLPFARFTHLL